MDLAFRMVLLGALVLAAFAHQVHPHSGNTPVGIDSRAYAAQYTLPDGTLPVLCEKSGHSGTHPMGAMPCEFCSLVEKASLCTPEQARDKAGFGFAVDNRLMSHNVMVMALQPGLHGASRAPPMA